MFVDSLYSQFIYKSRYSRYIEKEKRRESWPETVKRYFDFIEESLKEKNNFDITPYRPELELAVLNHDIMPSMRALMTAGPAAKKNNVAIYNCAYLPMDDIKSFDEEMAILMSGTGVGYSVESAYIKNLPELPDEFFPSETIIIFDDSRLGWAKGFREFMSLLLIGQVPKYDVSQLRAAGARLKTMGGRCLSGDTIVYKDRKVDRGYNEITLAKLFDLQINFPHRFEQMKLRSLDEDTGEFFRNKIKSVIYNGNRMTYNLVTSKGYRIKATENHRFMNELGEYQFLSDFDIGDKIAVNGSTERKTGICIDCGDNISRRAIRCKECNRVSQFKDDCLDTTSRQRLEVKRYKAGVLFCEICGLENVEFECHHVDGDPWNNNENNLQNLCISCHRAEDMKRIYFGNPYACKYMMYDEIIEITEAGEEEVYDLEMEGPNHNFIANGFVSHNSSGPEPLVDLLEFTKNLFIRAAGRKITTLEAHDLACKIADIVVVGGVRRSALISLSDLTDERMRDAKSGNWWMTHPYRRLANNSAVYDEKPEIGVFMREWVSLYESKSGERGIISRQAIKNVIANANEFRRQIYGKEDVRYRDVNHNFGTNPCSEIILRPYEFCNLTEVVIYEDDTPETIRNKIRLATILGTFQSCFTNFKYINKKWQKNCEDERLLGVSLTGIYDNIYTNGYNETGLDNFLSDLKAISIHTNIDLAALIGINSSVAITCVKPSGTSSALNGTSSGIHPAHSPFYVRYVRNDKKDPLTAFMIDAGFPYEKDAYDPNNVVCFKFPIKSSKDAVFKKNLTAIEHLELWLVYQKYFCEHKPSITVSVKESEWLEVGAWVYKNFDLVSGISFLPAEEGSTVYKQAPFTTCTEDDYNKLNEVMPVNVDWSKLTEYELEDSTTNAQELACVAGNCEIP